MGRPGMKTILSFEIVLALAVIVGLEAKYQLVAESASMPWFVSTCALVLILLSVSYVLVSRAKASHERERRQHAEQLFVGYIKKPGESEWESNTLLDIASNTQLGELEVFKVSSTERDSVKIDEYGRQANRVTTSKEHIP